MKKEMIVRLNTELKDMKLKYSEEKKRRMRKKTKSKSNNGERNWERRKKLISS